MTPSRYFFARIGQALGVTRKSQRLNEAASEVHLLREAEIYLGAMTWRNAENIDELSIEYWNLRKLAHHREEVKESIRECELRLVKAQDTRSELLDVIPHQQQQLFDERGEMLQKLEKLALERDRIIAEAKEVRRQHDGLKLKLEVLSKEKNVMPDAESLASLRQRLLSLREKFAELKEQRGLIGEKIDAADAAAAEIDARIASVKTANRSQTSESFLHIGESNRTLSTLRAEVGYIEAKMQQLYGDIGRYISRNQGSIDSAILQSQSKLIELMSAIRVSIALNHRLAGLSA